ncbi:DUF3306 domain-containing protein [Marinobacter halophilus]|uniref:DUF3306 domain-containing protein n=1 Tax=Marinobacter halophilus TaxID=1323740 RepID=A0A2T1KKX3_9GAMM|nr:DUF3306 domain-containing protein [Marinobacter halophilus]PSF10282.1 DUF3306 domain-containing protein [Marinobacter halophilus]GGC69408.1 hypothetical protein GCM10011362_17360 [Marinobacter halophilus]
MAESRLQRWSRKKANASKEPELAPPQTVEPELSPEEQELIINETLTEIEVLEKYDLPDPNAIELGTDIKGFMQKEIPELLRRKALRSLWKSNPVLAVLDGLNDYDEDFTDAANTGKAIQTLYKVGQGFDRTPKVEEKAGAEIDGQIQALDGSPETNSPSEVAETLPDESLTERSEPEIAVGSATTRQVEPALAEAEPSYRPRMRFE